MNIVLVNVIGNYMRTKLSVTKEDITRNYCKSLMVWPMLF